MPGADAVGTFFFTDAKVWRDYSVGFDLTGLTGVEGIKLELIDAFLNHEPVDWNHAAAGVDLRAARNHRAPAGAGKTVLRRQDRSTPV